jgi:uncharacterized protein
MPGETNLSTLIAAMRPVLRPGIFVFSTLADGRPVPAGIDPVMVFREAEGRTLILSEEAARAAGLAATFRCRMITLEIHSSLDAVGFLAAITARLAAAGIGVNPVSAYFHDHLFVPEERAKETVAILEALAAEKAAAIACP